MTLRNCLRMKRHYEQEATFLLGGGAAEANENHGSRDGPAEAPSWAPTYDALQTRDGDKGSVVLRIRTDPPSVVSHEKPQTGGLPPLAALDPVFVLWESTL